MLPFAPETNHLFKGYIPQGRLVDHDRVLDIPKWRVNDQFRARLQHLIAMLCHSQPPQPKPSDGECRDCKVPSPYCWAKMGKVTGLPA